MTDANTPDRKTAPGPDDADLGDTRDVDLSPDRSGDTPGAPGSDEPMTDSTDGGLDAGDPGVEE